VFTPWMVWAFDIPARFGRIDHRSRFDGVSIDFAVGYSRGARRLNASPGEFPGASQKDVAEIAW